MPWDIRLLSVRTACLAGAAALVRDGCRVQLITVVLQAPAVPAIAPSQPPPRRPGGSITVLESSGYSGAWSNPRPGAEQGGRRHPGLHDRDLRAALRARPGRDGRRRPGYRLLVQPRRQDRHDHDPAGREVHRRHAVQRAGGGLQLGAGPRPGRHQERPRPAVAHRQEARAEGQPARHASSRPSRGPSRSPGRTRSSFTRSRRTAPSSTSCSTRSPTGSPRRPPCRRKARRSARTRSAPGRSRW